MTHAEKCFYTHRLQGILPSKTISPRGKDFTRQVILKRVKYLNKFYKNIYYIQCYLVHQWLK